MVRESEIERHKHECIKKRLKSKKQKTNQMNMNLTLDVCCGNRPRGDINIDLTKHWNPMRYKNKMLGINYKEIPNFILADAQLLPFQPKTFKLVINFSSLEHIKNPTKAIKEMIRVCKEKIEIYVPHRLASGSRKWRNQFNVKWFRNLLETLYIFDYKIQTRETKIPHKIFPIFSIPYGLDVTLRCHARIER